MNYLLQEHPAYTMVQQNQPDVLLWFGVIFGIYGLAYVLIQYLQKQKLGKKES